MQPKSFQRGLDAVEEPSDTLNTAGEPPRDLMKLRSFQKKFDAAEKLPNRSDAADKLPNRSNAADKPPKGLDESEEAFEEVRCS